MHNVKNLYEKIDKLFVGESLDISKYESVEFIDHVAECKDFRQQIVNHLFGQNRITGDCLPWQDSENTIRFRPHEVTVWNGINGHGKSALLNQVVLGFLLQGSKCLIASLEMRPEETLSRMIGQAYAIEPEKLTIKAIDEFFPMVDGQLFLYKDVGDIEQSRVHALCRYARAELGIDHIIIDSMMKCGLDEGEGKQEKAFMNTIQNIAKSTGIHIHLVTHAKKGLDEYKMPGKFDVHGSAHITNMPDNLMIVFRNKRKEEESVKINPEPSVMEKPDAFLKCAKQRHGNGWEGTIGLWFHSSRHYSKTEGKHKAMI